MEEKGGVFAKALDYKYTIYINLNIVKYYLLGPLKAFKSANCLYIKNIKVSIKFLRINAYNIIILLNIIAIANLFHAIFYNL